MTTGLLSDPVRGGMFSDAKDMHAAGGVLDNRETVQPGQQHGVAMEKVAGQNPFSLGTQEFAPGWTRALWTRIDSGALEDCPVRGGAALPAHTGQFSGDAPVSPSWVLLGHPQDYRADRGPRGWTPRSLPRECRSPFEEISVPAQQRARCDEQLPTTG